MGDRRTEVITFPSPIRSDQPGVAEALERLRGTVGLASSLVLVPLLLSETGVAVVGAALGTAFTQAKGTLNLEDARIDQVRLEGYGGSSGSGDTARVKAGSTVICTATLAASPGRFVGAWTTVDALPAGDLTFDLEAVGNSVRTQTIHRAVLHARTLRIR